MDCHQQAGQRILHWRSVGKLVDGQSGGWSSEDCMLADITHNSVDHRQSTMETFRRWQIGKVTNYQLLTCPPDVRTKV